MLEQFDTGIFYFPEDVHVSKFLSILSSTNPLLLMRKKPILKLLHVGSLIFDKFSQQADVFDFLTPSFTFFYPVNPLLPIRSRK